MDTFDDTSSLAINGTTLAFREMGEGPPLVLVHGGVSDMRTWNNQVSPFGEHYRTIVYSRRYHLPNPPISPDAPDPIQNHVDDLSSLIETLDACPANIVAHSWGALTAIILAMQRPELMHSLVLIEPPIVSMHVHVPPKLSQMVRLFLRNPKLAIAIAKLGGGALAPAEKAFRKGDDKLAIEIFGRGVLGNQRFVSLSAERYQQVWDNRGTDRAQALYKGFPDLISASFEKVIHPVLLVAGSESPDVFRLLNIDLVKRLPNAKNKVIHGASHIVQEDAPLALNEPVLSFLDEVN